MKTAVETAVVIQNLLVLLDLGGEGHRVRAGVHARDDVELLLVDQPLDLVDGDVGLALGIDLEGGDLVLAADAAALVAELDRDVGANR